MRTRLAALVGVALGLSVAGVTVLVGTASSSSSSSSRAAGSDYLTSPTLDHIKSSGQLRACVDPEFPPEVFTKNGQPAGFDVALTQQLATSLGASVSWVPSSFDGLIAGLQAGQVRHRPLGHHAARQACALRHLREADARRDRGHHRQEDRRPNTTFATLNSPKVKFCDQTGTGSEFDQAKYFPKAKVVKVPSSEDCLLQVRLGQG